MMTRLQVMTWLATLPPDSGIAITDNEYSLVELRNGQLTGSYCEVGGVPLEEHQCRGCGEEIEEDQEGWLCKDCDAKQVVPTDFPVKVLTTDAERANAHALVTCGTCGRSWDDAIVTSMTPVPSARCPFEMFHV